MSLLSQSTDRPEPRSAPSTRAEDRSRGRELCGRGARTGGARLILDDVSLSVQAGGIFTILGPSGSGKSTLLRTVNRLIEPSAGRVLLDGVPIGELPVQELRRRVGMVFQTAALFEGTVMDNVLYGPRLTQTGRGPSDGEAQHDLARSLLRRVGLPAAFCEKPADELSGGEAQRVSLARALANEPEVLLLDEPTASLDLSSSQLIEALLLRLAAETDLTFIFVTHNLVQARRIGDHGLLLVDGRVVDSGSAAGLSRRALRRRHATLRHGHLRRGDAVSAALAASVATQQFSYLNVAAALVLVGIALLLSWREHLGLEKDLTHRLRAGLRAAHDHRLRHPSHLRHPERRLGRCS